MTSALIKSGSYESTVIGSDFSKVPPFPTEGEDQNALWKNFVMCDV